ncbi:hypothetical protein M885DRAFT_559962 [Pelagophyceae sp. CCMP2097]|nr:hypothetical protein M885DRAFT_559962 [Pelagophyceae sp. CCMP2097]
MRVCAALAGLFVVVAQECHRDQCAPDVFIVDSAGAGNANSIAVFDDDSIQASGLNETRLVSHAIWAGLGDTTVAGIGLGGMFSYTAFGAQFSGETTPKCPFIAVLPVEWRAADGQCNPAILYPFEAPCFGTWGVKATVSANVTYAVVNATVNTTASVTANTTANTTANVTANATANVTGATAGATLELDIAAACFDTRAAATAAPSFLRRTVSASPTDGSRRMTKAEADAAPLPSGGAAVAAMAAVAVRRVVACTALAALALAAGHALADDADMACACNDIGEPGAVHVAIFHAPSITVRVDGSRFDCFDNETGAPAPCLRADGACVPVQRWQSNCAYGRPLESGVEAATFWVRAGALMSEADDAVAADDAVSPLLDSAAWARRAAAEHASVASFAEYTLRLVAAGAPLHLIADAAEGQGDEVRHAAAAYSIAARLRGPGWAAQPGPLEARHVGEAPVDALLALVEASWAAGCIAETRAALAAVEDVEAFLRLGALAEVAHDERRHALLAWRAVAWACLESGAARLLLAAKREALGDDDTARRVIRPATDTILAATAAPLAASQRSDVLDAIYGLIEPRFSVAAHSV